MNPLTDVLNSVDETVAILSAQDIIDNPENFGEPTEEFSITLQDANGNSVTVGTVDVSDTFVFGGGTTVEGRVFLGSDNQAADAGVNAPARTLETRNAIDTSAFEAFSMFDSFSAFSFFDF